MLWHPCLTVLISLDGVENLQRSLLDNHQYCTVIVYDSLILCYIAHILSVFCVFITYLFTLQWNLPQTKFLLSYSESCLKLNPFYPTVKPTSNWIPFILQSNLPQTESLLSYSETYLKLNPFYPTVKAASNWTPFTLQWNLPQMEPLLPYSETCLKLNPFRSDIFVREQTCISFRHVQFTQVLHIVTRNNFDRFRVHLRQISLYFI